MSNTLLPCPFCGGTPILELFNDGFFDYARIRCCRVMFDWCGDETGEQAIAAWNRRTGKDINVPTNADRIRSMSDEELAREMLFFVPSDFNRHYTGIAGGYYATADEAIQANFDWLKQPVKEE